MIFKRHVPILQALVEDKRLLETQPLTKVFIQFVCVAGQTVGDFRNTDRNCLVAKHLLPNIIAEDANVAEIFRCISDRVYQESKHTLKPFSMGRSNDFIDIYFKKTNGTYTRKV